MARRGRLPRYGSISDLIANSSKPAITPVDDRASLTHTQLKDLIYKVDDELKTWGVTQAGSRVGVAVPNGPELMSVLLSVIDRHTCVPVNPATTPQEIARGAPRHRGWWRWCTKGVTRWR